MIDCYREVDYREKDIIMANRKLTLEEVNADIQRFLEGDDLLDDDTLVRHEAPLFSGEADGSSSEDDECDGEEDGACEGEPVHMIRPRLGPAKRKLTKYRRVNSIGIYVILN